MKFGLLAPLRCIAKTSQSPTQRNETGFLTAFRRRTENSLCRWSGFHIFAPIGVIGSGPIVHKRCLSPLFPSGLHLFSHVALFADHIVQFSPVRFHVIKFPLAMPFLGQLPFSVAHGLVAFVFPNSGTFLPNVFPANAGRRLT